MALFSGMDSMPKTWLAGLVACVRLPERNALLSTCTTIQCAVLANKALEVKLSPVLHLPVHSPSLVCRACLLAEQHAPSWHLVLTRVLTIPHLFAGHRQLLNLTHLTLQFYPLPPLLPGEFLEGCPKLERLTHYGTQQDDSEPALPDDATTPDTATQPDKASLTPAAAPSPAVKHLVLIYVDRRRLIKPDYEAQLRTFTNLVSVHIERGWNAWIDLVSVIGSQLTRLTCAEDMPSLGGRRRFSERFPNLTVLHLGGLQVNDRRMPVLLELTQLQELQVESFVLNHSFADRVCTWQRVSVIDVFVKSLGRLPSGGCSFNSIKLRCVLCGFHIEDDHEDEDGVGHIEGGGASEVDAVRSSVHRFLSWGCLQWSPDVRQINLNAYDADLDTEADAIPTQLLYLEALPLLSTFTGSILLAHWAFETPDVLDSLQQSLNPAVRQLCFMQCYLSAAAKAQLAHSLPAGVVRVSIGWVEAEQQQWPGRSPGWSLEEVEAVCLAVESRPLTFVVSMHERDEALWPRDWHVRLSERLVAAGRTNVQVARVPLQSNWDLGYGVRFL